MLFFNILCNNYYRFLESLKIVRRKHCIAFRRSTEAGVHKPTQLDMALAQFGFIGYTLVSDEYLGIKTTPEEMEGVVHLWRIIGSMLGMDDKFVQLFIIYYLQCSNKNVSNGKLSSGILVK